MLNHSTLYKTMLYNIAIITYVKTMYGVVPISLSTLCRTVALINHIIKGF